MGIARFDSRGGNRFGDVDRLLDGAKNFEAVAVMKKILYAFAVLACLWIAGLMRFNALVNRKPVSESLQTEAIIALTGGTERLSAAVNLLKQGKAQKLLISGVDRKVDWMNLAQTVDELPPELIDRITLGHVACNTTENALESRDWMTRNGFKSLRLVTASYHMPRSYAEFKNVMPEMVILPHPVFPQTFTYSSWCCWWKWRGSTALIVSEYTKYLFVSLRHLLGWGNTVFNPAEVCRK